MDLSHEELAIISKLLDEALEVPMNARSAWLDNVNISERLKPLLRKLLEQQSTDDANGFLDTLPKFTKAPLDHTDRQPLILNKGSEIGAYRILRHLGTGGMGTVWLAERIDGLIKRTVAIKLPHLGRHHSAFVERFHRERDILATLTHPYIARLYDAGLSDGGQPFLAMEYIEGGVPITDYCDQQHLSIPARLQLFLQVLEAVQYAHAQKVIHRDLKPSNVLVTPDGQVRLLDFGIAKLIGDDTANETALTQTGYRALTPVYASPEQIAGKPLGPSSGVYSLGVILYELLVGKRPYSSNRIAFEKQSHEEPLQPSECAKDSAGALARNTTPKTWLRTLRGNLDAIVLMALKSEVHRRYATVDEFALDLKRHISGQPILASADNHWVRLGKFFARHKAPTATAIAILMSLGAGFGYAHWAYGIRQMQNKVANENLFINLLLESDAVSTEQQPSSWETQPTILSIAPEQQSKDPMIDTRDKLSLHPSSPDADSSKAISSPPISDSTNQKKQRDSIGNRTDIGKSLNSPTPVKNESLVSEIPMPAAIDGTVEVIHPKQPVALTENMSSSTAPASTLKKLRETGSMVIGFRPEAIPFSYFRHSPDKPDNDDPIGYGVDICQRIAQNIQRDLKLPKLDIHYVPVTPKERFDALKQGKIDLECANTSNTRERREKMGVAFTIPYYITGAKILVRSDLKASNLNDLTGRTIAVVKNTIATAMMQKQDNFHHLKLNYVEVENRKQATEFLETRKADAFVQDDIVLYNVRLAMAAPASYEVIGDFLSIEPISIMLRANDPEFKRLIDQQIVSMIQAGELQSLYKKWFENPIPPNGRNLNVPMSLLMRDMMRYPTDKIDTYPPD